jgi:hypothetical protein
MKLPIYQKRVSVFVAGGTKGKIPGPPMAVKERSSFFDEPTSSFAENGFLIKKVRNQHGDKTVNNLNSVNYR